MNRTLVTVLRWLVIICMPVVVTLAAARVMVNEWYPRYEYAKPDFPPDPYGLTQAQRLELGTASIRFLNHPEPADAAIRLLRELRLPGTDRPLFTTDELSHMADVKRVTDVLWPVLTVTGLIVVGGLALLLARRATRRDGYIAILNGGRLTTGLLVLMIVFVLTSWRTFFVQFHEVFFPQGNWTFDWSDSLIRLFPDRFWFDAGVLLVGGALGMGLLVLGIGYWLVKKVGR